MGGVGKQGPDSLSTDTKPSLRPTELTAVPDSGKRPLVWINDLRVQLCTAKQERRHTRQVMEVGVRTDKKACWLETDFNGGGVPTKTVQSLKTA